MKISIELGSYDDETYAITHEIVSHLRKLGLTVDVLTTEPSVLADPAHNVILRRMREEGFPITVDWTFYPSNR